VVGLNRRAVNPGASQIPIGNAPMPASQQQTLVDAGSVMYHVDKIKKLYPLIGDDNLGPVMGTRNRAWLTTGKTIEGAMGGVNKPPPAEFAQFNTQIAGLKNRIIRLVTGAAVQRDEEARIMQQVPDWTDVPEMFRAKLEGLAAIEQDLIQRIQKRKLAHLPTIGFEDQAGGGGAAPGAGADPDPYHINDLFPGGQ
jgi:hypothetical protein